MSEIASWELERADAECVRDSLLNRMDEQGVTSEVPCRLGLVEIKSLGFFGIKLQAETNEDADWVLSHFPGDLAVVVQLRPLGRTKSQEAA